MAATKYTYSKATDFPSDLDSTLLAAEIGASAIAGTLQRISTLGDVVDIWFADALSAGDKTLLDNDVSPPTGGSVLGDHTKTHPVRNAVSIAPFAAFEAIEPQASTVVANDRPAIECQNAASAYGAAQGVWPLPADSLAKIWCCMRFIVKASGTGSNVRVAMKVKADSLGADTSGAFTVSGFTAVPVNFTTIGECFEAAIELDASAFAENDSLAIHIGRDGDEALGGGTADDVDQPIQIISAMLEAR
jgi:hypothetical protein